MYIQYTMDQLSLPMDLAEDIPEHHLVRVVNAAVNRLDDTIFEDHMRNDQLKPGFNVRVGTEYQFILAYSVYQSRADTCCFQPHMEKARRMLGKFPQTIIADEGYSSEITPIWNKKRFRLW